MPHQNSPVSSILRTKIGRPRLPKAEALGVVFCIRLRPGEAAGVRQAVRASGLEQADWLRAALTASARAATAQGQGEAAPSPLAR